MRVLGDPDPCWKGWQLEGIRVVTRLIAVERIAAAVLSRVYAPGRSFATRAKQRWTERKVTKLMVLPL